MQYTYGEGQCRFLCSYDTNYVWVVGEYMTDYLDWDFWL
jgi:hypothetical protein